MKFLSKYYNVVSLEYFINHQEELSGRKNIVITFDDGYKDNFTIAYPILRKYKLPATIFLATDFIDTNKTKFEDILTSHFASNHINTIDIDSLRLKKELKNETERNAAITQFLYTLNRLDSKKREDVIHEVSTKYGIESNCSNNVMLTWDGIMQMDRQLISFGAHSTSHQNLTKLPYDQQIDEINKSKSAIEHHLESAVASFSYPLGFFDKNIIKALRDSGYKCAVTTISGVNNSDMDLFQLKRISAVNNFHFFKFRLICQAGPLHDLCNKLTSSFM